MSSKPTIKFVFKENPDGSRTVIESDDFFGCTSPYTKRWNTSDKERFHEERIAIEKGDVRYICGGCLNPVVLRGGRNEEGVAMYFRHKGDAPEDCPFEEGKQALSEQQMRALKYKGLQESYLHDNLKNFIASTLENQGYSVCVEKSLRINDKQVRRPDVLAIKEDQNIVFEIQMSTTFLNVVVGRMIDYSSINHSVIWIFYKFEPEVYTTKDTYQFQNNNVFILDDEMMNLSAQNKRLTFKVYYLEYTDNGESSPLSEWKNRIVTLDDLTFDKVKGVYYFDSKTNRSEVISKIEHQEICRRNVKNGLYKIESLDQLNQAEMDALCSSPNQDIDNRIANAINEGKYADITPHNITYLFQYLEVLKSRGMERIYEDLKYRVKYEIKNNEEYQNYNLWDWDGFNILNHPSITADIDFMFVLYHLGYWPDDQDVKDIRKALEEEFKNTRQDEKASDTFLYTLTHYWLLNITQRSNNFRERKELITLYRDNFSFISCVIAITMRRFVEHNFSNLIGFCNYVWDNYRSFCGAFIRIIDHSKIDRSMLVSKKGVNHYNRIKEASQAIPPAMDRLLSILIPKVWLS